MRPTDEEFLAIAADNGASTGRGSESRLEWVDFHSYAEFNAFARAIYRMGQEEMRERASNKEQDGLPPDHYLVDVCLSG